MAGKLVVRGAYRSDKAGDADLEKVFEKFLQQIARDVLVGTFDDYDRSIFRNRAAFDAFTGRSTDASNAFSELSGEAVGHGVFDFRIELDPTLFSDPDYGLQRLVHTLASDLFERRIDGFHGRVTIREIVFGPVKDAMIAAYRGNSHSRNDIRTAFALKDNRPLLAFS